MKVFGLLGEKLSHSLSPAIHGMIYDTLGIEATYSLYEIQPSMLEAAVKGVRALGIDGVNVTIPYKLQVMDHLDSISKEAKRIGAVNTIHHQTGLLKGYNTDYIGFGRMLDRNSITTSSKKAVVLGTGGAAKAVVTYLEDHGIKDIAIISRDPDSVAATMGFEHSIMSYSQLEQLKHAELLVNCTPCGMYPKVDYSPISEEIVSHFDAVVDLIYNPSETLLLKQAARNDIIAVNGLYMLIEQAVAAAEIWLEYEIDSKIADEIYLNMKQK